MKNSLQISGVARRYGLSLFELADEGKNIDSIRGELAGLKEGLAQSKELRAFVESPLMTAEEQIATLDKILPGMKFSSLVSNFVKLLARNRRLSFLRDSITAFERLADEKKGLATAEVTSAEPLSDQQAAALKSALKETTGKDIALLAHVDQTLIGGMIVKLGSRMIDTSLKTKLNSMKTALKGTG